LLDRLLAEAGSAENTPQVRAILNAEIANLADWLSALESPTAHQQLALEDIVRWQGRVEGIAPPKPASQLPPGSPIGGRAKQ